AHLLVYQTGEGYTSLEKTLGATGIECRIYGVRRDLAREEVEGNLRYRPFSEAGFIDDLGSARAVIAGGGFTLMGEAVYLRKPMLSVPLRGQFEQIMNARYLAASGFGAWTFDVANPRVVPDFLDRLPAYASALDGYAQDGNEALTSALDHLLDRAEAGVLRRTK
ncbi:MAG: glycosyltransferase family protein, partial [Myxococcota bacterium]